jgi:hypothetical protein
LFLFAGVEFGMLSSATLYSVVQDEMMMVILFAIILFQIENSSFCMECAAPVAPFRGNVSVSGAGTVAIYTCNLGFSLRWGSTEHSTVERKCLKQGVWDGPTPFCIRKNAIISERLYEMISNILV